MDDSGFLHGGPFREPGHGYAGRCPRCQRMLASASGDRQVCPGRCGTWLSINSLDGIVALDKLDAFTVERGSWLALLYPPVECAVCSAVMSIRTEPELTFDFCSHHGVWLDRGELEAFDVKCVTRSWRSERAMLQPR